MCKHCWDNDKSGPHHKDFIRGAVGEEDFVDEIPYRHAPHKAKDKKKKAKGCPENDFGPHVYVWVPSTDVYDWWPGYKDDFYEKNGFHRRESKVCCGCGRKQASRDTEEMAKLVAKKGWYQANYG